VSPADVATLRSGELVVLEPPWDQDYVFLWSHPGSGSSEMYEVGLVPRGTFGLVVCVAEAETSTGRSTAEALVLARDSLGWVVPSLMRRARPEEA